MTDDDVKQKADALIIGALSGSKDAALIARLHADASNELAMAMINAVNAFTDKHPNKKQTTCIVGAMLYATANIIAQRTSTHKKECILSKAGGEYLHIVTHALGFTVGEKPDAKDLKEELPPEGTTKH